ncbi:MAG: MarR family winged helix-turn-helix transcriptional regulator [Acidimicrobiia bacterium]
MPTSARATEATEAAELAGRLRLAVTRLARQMRQETDTGLSPTLLATLASVAAAGPLTLGELAVREKVAPPTITRAVAGLESDGLVVRRIDPADRRVARVEVTPTGRRLLERARTRKNAWLVRRLRGLPSDDVRRLTEAVGALEALAGQPDLPDVPDLPELPDQPDQPGSAP